MRALIFDFDGVIHDTFEFHRRNVREFVGKEISEQDYRDIHNGNFFNASCSWVKNVDWVKYGDYICEEFSCLEIEQDIRDIILALSAKKELYIISSNHTRNIINYLKNNKINFSFKEVLGSENIRSKVAKFKLIFQMYALNSDDCLFVTDTLGDILEANKVGVKTIAVDFGFHDRQTLQRGTPYKIISDFNELQKVIQIV